MGKLVNNASRCCGIRGLLKGSDNSSIRTSCRRVLSCVVRLVVNNYPFKEFIIYGWLQYRIDILRKKNSTNCVQ